MQRCQQIGGVRHFQRSSRAQGVSLHTRALSSATGTTTKERVEVCGREQPQNSEPISRDALKSRILTLLHKSDSIFPKVLPEAAEYTKDVKDALNRSHSYINERSETGTKEKRRIVVIGDNSNKRRETVVNVLLDDGFTLNDAGRKALRERWNYVRGTSESIVLSSENPSANEESTRVIRSSFLTRHNANLIEVRSNNPLKDSEYLDADIVIDCNSSSSLLNKYTSPNRILLSELPSRNSSVHSSSSSPSPTQSIASEMETIPLDPERALQGIEALLHNPSSTSSIAIYQHDTLASGLSSLHSSIHRHLSSPSIRSTISPPFGEEDEREISKINFAKNTLGGVSNLVSRSIENEREDIAIVKSAQSTLRDLTKALSTSIQDDVFGAKSEHITNSLAESEKAMKKTLNVYSWWKLPFKVDDLGSDIISALKLSWCRSLEHKIIYESGRLQVLQITLRSQTRLILSNLPPSYQSPVLSNGLDQLSTSRYAIKPRTLTLPLSTRLSQLITYTTPALHRSAQSAVLKGTVISMGSLGGSYSTYFYLPELISPETSVAVGLLGVVIGMKWAQSTWEKAKKEWWRGWKRVGNGLEDDLKTTLRENIERNIMAVPEYTADGVEGKIIRWSEKMSEIEKENDALKWEIDQL